MDIRTEQLYFSYPNGVQALRGIDLVVETGEQVAIVGQNGAGKTTLVKHFNGLLKPSQGQVFVGDWTTAEHTVAELARRVGYVFQNPDDQLFSRTVAQEVAVGPRHLGYEPQQVESLVAQALALTGLESERTTNPYDLPPTTRKLVALASILAMDTPVLILDEPTTGQDAAAIRRMGQIVRTVAEAGKTVITITHDMEFAAAHFRRMVVLRQGEVLLDGPTGQVVAQEEVLAQTDVQPPQLTRLGLRLGLAEPVLTVEDLLEGVNAYSASGGSRKI